MNVTDNMNDIDNMDDFDIMVKNKYRDELLQSSLYKTHRDIKLRNVYDKDNNTVKTDTVKTERVVIEPIGDTFLENILQITLPKYPNDDTLVQQLVAYKRDYVIMTNFKRKNPNTDIIEYSIYAVTKGNDTRVIDLTRKEFVELPIICYDETNDDPTKIVDKVYTYQTGAIRTTNQRQTGAYISTPAKDYILSLDLDTVPQPELSFGSNTTVLTVPQDLFDLAVIIKNKAYISSAPYDKLLETVDYLTIF